MEDIIHRVLSSDRFQEISREGEKGFFDKQEQVFISKKSVPALIKEITVGPSVVLGTNRPDSHFALCQMRVKRILKSSGANHVENRYYQTLLRYLSSEFLKLFVNSKLDFAVLYVDIVGSTLLSMSLNPDRLSSLVNIFTKEMSQIVPQNHGFVLKYAGDCVIAIFPDLNGFEKMCTHALDCGIAMLNMVASGINEPLIAAGFEPLSVRIGIEAGMNQIMLVGGDVDIIGHTMNMAAKVTSMAKPNGICLGDKAFSSLNDGTQKKFVQVSTDPTSWKYKNEMGQPFGIYELALDIESS